MDPLARGGAGIGACVQIAGAWEGAVRVDCSTNLARLATARFLAADPGDIVIDQIRDAMGELANMSAGSVKPLLPKPCQISLPSVADGTDYTFTVPQGQLVLETGFNFEGEALKISVLQRKHNSLWTGLTAMSSFKADAMLDASDLCPPSDRRPPAGNEREGGICLSVASAGVSAQITN